MNLLDQQMLNAIEYDTYLEERRHSQEPPAVYYENGRPTVNAAAFQAQQVRLRARGGPNDPCGRCGCRRKEHLPTPTFSYAKSGGSSGKSIELNCLAPTSCDCHFCICFCVAFMEPFTGQPFSRCTYEK